MSENTTEVIVGGVVLAAAVGFFLYMGQMTGASGGRGNGYELIASFRSAEGISLGSDVRLAGVKVGTVTGMALNPQTFRADVSVSVLDGIEVPEDSTIQISSEGLLGGNFVELVPGGSPIILEPGEEVVHTQGAVSLVTLLSKFVSGGGDDE